MGGGAGAPWDGWVQFKAQAPGMGPIAGERSGDGGPGRFQQLLHPSLVILPGSTSGQEPALRVPPAFHAVAPQGAHMLSAWQRPSWERLGPLWPEASYDATEVNEATTCPG